MKIVSIFAGKLYAFQYDDESHDEFNRLFDQWTDLIYLEDFFERNKTDIFGSYWNYESVEVAVFHTLDHADELRNRFIELAGKKKRQKGIGLDLIFASLSEKNLSVMELRPSKSKKSWLRMYALRIGNDVYVITGGAIKLTQKMQDRPHTDKELRKTSRCRDWLLEKGIVDHTGFIEELESQ